MFKVFGIVATATVGFTMMICPPDAGDSWAIRMKSLCLFGTPIRLTPSEIGIKAGSTFIFFDFDGFGNDA